MKELSIKQKAQKYDEAIERAKKWYNAPNADKIPTYANRVINEIFPELAESEDERIRKELLNAFKESEDSLYMVLTPQRRKSFIAWLEKQDDANKEYWRGYREGKQEILDKYAEFEKQGEKGTNGNNGEIPHSWSEEDESMRTRCIGILGKCYMGELPTKVEEELNWLKSLKDRVQPQKQEWSMYDETILKAIIDHFEYKKEFNEAEDYDIVLWLKSLRPQNNITDEELAQAKKDAYNDALDKIEYHSGEPTFDDGWSAAIDYIRKKSLRPQNTWKPSDEQMEALNICLIKGEISYVGQSSILQSLYDKLKTL